MGFFAANRRIFDGGIRDSGGCPQIRPVWVADPTLYPIEDLPWGVYMDARDTANQILDVNGDVQVWQSSLAMRDVLAVSEPYRFKLFGEVIGTSNPSLNLGTATPSGEPHISFDGVGQRFRSGTHYLDIVNDNWGYGYYTASAGIGLDQGVFTNANKLNTPPAAYVLTGFWDSSYTGAGGDPWPGTASAGTSSANGLTDVSGWVAASGNVINGYAPADFPGYGWMTGAAMSTFLTAAAWSVSVTFFADVADVDAGAGLEFANPALVTDSNAMFILSFTDAGVNLNIADGVGAYTTLTIACSISAWHMVNAWYDGTDYWLQLDNGTPISQTHGNIGNLTNTLVVGANYDQSTFFNGQIAQIVMSDTNIGIYFPTMGRANQDKYAINTNHPGSFYQRTAANVPLYVGGARGDGIDDYLDTDLLLSQIFASDGSSGTMTFSFYGDSAAVFAPGTVTAQTPYANPAVFSDAGGYFNINFTDAGITVGGYDGVPRDSGGGPGTNDGWQMVSAALPVTTDGIVQVRWGLADLLEVRVVTYAGSTGWQTCAFSGIQVPGYKGRLFANYAVTAFVAGIVYNMTAQNRRLTDPEADDAIYTLAASIGINTTANVLAKDGFAAFGGGPPSGGSSTGFVSFTVARANSRTTTTRGYQSKWIWGLDSYYVGLGATEQSGNAALTSFAFDGGGSIDYNVDVPLADDTWGLVTSQIRSKDLSTKLDGTDADYYDFSTNFIAYGGVPATVGTAVNGFTPAIFDGATEGLITDLTAANYISKTAYTSISLVYIPAGTAAAPSGNTHTDPGIWMEAGLNCGLTFNTSGASAIVYDGAQVFTPSMACSTGAYHLIVTRLDGINLKIRIDGVNGTSAACGPVSGIPGALTLGVAPGIAYQALRVLAQVFVTTELSNAQVDGIGTFLQTRYAQSLGFTATSLDPRTVASATTWLASYAGDPWVGDRNSPTKSTLASNTSTGSQFVYMGYGVGGYLDGAVAFWGSAPTSGWSDVRIQDVEAYLNTVFLTAVGGTSPIAATINSVSTTTANLTGAGAVTSTIAGVDTVTGNVTGAGAIASTVPGVSTTIANLVAAGTLASTINNVNTVTANLVGAGTVASTVANVNTVTGNLLGAGSVASTIAGVDTVTANTLGAGALASTVASANTVIATLSIHATVPGVSTTTANVTGAGAVASTIANVNTVTATINGAVPAASTIAGVSTTTANVLGAGTIASTAASISTTTANLLGAGSITSNTAGVSTTIATLQLHAKIDGVSTTTANLDATVLAASTIANVSTTIAAITGAAIAASSIANVSTTTANLVGAGTLASTSNSVSTTTAGLLASGSVSSTVNGVSTTEATLQIYAIVSGISTTTAAITASGLLDSTSSSISTTVASITGELPAASTINSVSTITADISANLQATATINSTNTTTANLLGAGALASSTSGTSTTVATLDITANITGTSTTTANLTASGSVASTSGAVSTTTANILGAGQLDSTIAGVNTVAGNVVGAGAVSSTVNNVSTTIATLDLSATIGGVSTTIAGLAGNVEAASTVNGTSTTIATLDLTAIVNSAATIVASINGAIPAASTINGISTTDASADLTGFVTATISGISTTTASALGDGALNAQIDGTSTATLVSIEGEMVATIHSTSDTTGNINGAIPAASTVNSVSTVSANVLGEGNIASTISGASTTTAALLASGLLSSSISNTSTTIASIFASVPAAATIDGVNTTTALLTGSVPAAATINNVSTTTASVTAAGQLDAAIANIATVTASASASGIMAATTANVSTTIADVVGSGTLTSTSAGVSTSTAALLATGSIQATIAGTSTTTFLTDDSLIATVNSASTVSANINGQAAIGSVVNSQSTTEASIYATGLVTSLVSGESNTVANLLATANASSQIDGVSTTVASLVGEAPGAIQALVSSSSDTQADIMGEAAIFAICDNESFITATIENLDPDRINIYAMLNGTSSIRAYIVNYLADKRINNPPHIITSDEELFPHVPPRLIYETNPPETLPPTEPEPPIVDPVIPTGPTAIMKSGDYISTPIRPILITKIVPPPEPAPEPEPVIDPAIGKSDESLGTPVPPRRITKSNNSIN